MLFTGTLLLAPLLVSPDELHCPSFQDLDLGLCLFFTVFHTHHL